MVNYKVRMGPSKQVIYLILETYKGHIFNKININNAIDDFVGVLPEEVTDGNTIDLLFSFYISGMMNTMNAESNFNKKYRMKVEDEKK